MADQQKTDARASALVERPKTAIDTLRDMLTQYKANFAAVLPKHLTVDRLLQVALAAVSRNPGLLRCHPTSILRSLMVSAQLGLDPSGILGEGYLVPFWNKKTGRYEAQFIPGYRGLIKLARLSGEVTNVEAHVVYEKDAFEYRLGLSPLLNHVPSLEDDRGKVRGAYCIVRMKDNAIPLIEIMSVGDIEAIRRRSRAANEGPWVDDWSEMARKTVARRNLKYAPLTSEAARAMVVEDRFEAGEGIGDVVALPEIVDDEDTQPGSGEERRTKSDRIAGQLKQAKEAAAKTVKASENAGPLDAEVSAPGPASTSGGPADAGADSAPQVQCHHPTVSEDWTCEQCGQTVWPGPDQPANPLARRGRRLP